MMGGYETFQYFMWALWAVLSLVATIDWYRDKSVEFCVFRWVAIELSLLILFTTPCINMIVLILVGLGTIGEVGRRLNKKIALLRQKAGE